jgi:hypothetical protein
MAHTSGLTRYILYLALRALLRNVKNGSPAVFSLVASCDSPSGQRIALCQNAPGVLVEEGSNLCIHHKCKNHRKGGFDIYGAHIRIRT